MAWGLRKNDDFVWPDDLKSKTYPKAVKSGKIKTVTESLDEAEKFQAKIDPPFPARVTRQEALDTYKTRADAFLNSDGKKISGNLAVIKKRAEAAQKDKAIAKDKDCAAALTAIIKAADSYGKAAAVPVLRKQVDDFVTSIDKMLAEEAGKNFGKSIAAWKTVMAKAPGEMAVIVKTYKDGEKGNPGDTTATIKTKLYDLARDMTTPIGNLLKSHKQGQLVAGLTEPDYGAMQKMYKALVPFANTSSDWTKGNMETAFAGIRTVRAHIQLFDQIGKKMKA